MVDLEFGLLGLRFGLDYHTRLRLGLLVRLADVNALSLDLCELLARDLADRLRFVLRRVVVVHAVAKLFDLWTHQVWLIRVAASDHTWTHRYLTHMLGVPLRRPILVAIQMAGHPLPLPLLGPLVSDHLLGHLNAEVLIL